VGQAAAADYAVVADDVAAGVRVDDLLAVPQRARWALYPETLHGLNALVFALVASADAARIGAVTEAMEGLRHLASKRPGEGFESVPLSELAAFGFEILIGRALDAGLQDALLASDAYAAYAADREAAGLA